MLIRLYSNGRLTIPKVLRDDLRLPKNNLFRILVTDGKIILEPLPKEVVQRLHGKYAGYNLLTDWESEHLQEE